MTVSQLGRTKAVTWPDLNDPAGASQVNTIQAAIAELSNNANSRVVEFTAEADSTTVEVDHNLGLNLDQLSVFILSGAHPSYTRISNPTCIATPWGIAEKTGSEKLVLEITTPASGGPHTFAVVVLQDMDKDHQSARDLLSVAGNITLQNKVLHLVDTSAARTLTLPAPDAQLYVAIKDVTGNASSANISIETPGAETIDGAANFVMDNDSQSAAIISDGTNYFVVTGNGAGSGGLEVVFGSSNPGVLENGKHYRFTSAVSAATMPEITEDGQVIAISPSEGAEWSTNAITLTPHSGQAIDEDNGSVDDETFKLNMSGVDKVTFISKLSTLNWEVDTPVTPTNIGNGAIVTDWESYTPTTQGLGTISNVNLQWRRNGTNIEVVGDLTFGTVTAVEAQIGLPNNYTIALGGSGTKIVGHFLRDAGSVANPHHTLATNGDTYFNIGTTAVDSNFNPTTPQDGNTLGSSIRATMTASVPVAEFAGSGTTLTASDFSAKTEWVDNTVLNVTETSSNGLTVNSIRGRAIRDSKGQYLFEFASNMTKTNNASGVSFTMNGISSDINYPFLCTGWTDCEFQQASDQFNVGTSVGGTSRSGVHCSGLIVLDAKPSWFDANAEASFDMDLHFQEATPSVQGLSKAPRIQRKERTTNVGGTGEITELTFNNLTIGNWYRSSGIIQMTGTTANSTTHIELQTGGSSQIARLAFEGGTSGTHYNVCRWSVPFKATHAVAKIQVLAHNASALDANGGKSLFHVMEDLPNHVETTDWT